MPYVIVPADDPRAQCLAYVTNGERLFQVVDDRRGVLVLENCKSGARMTIGRAAIAAYRLIRAAPAVPDSPEEAVCQARS